MADLTGMLQAAAGVGGDEATYIEDVFSTYLYTGNGSTQTITNGIDLDGEGGLVWIKVRDNTDGHQLRDTDRGGSNVLLTNLTIGTATTSLSDGTITSFNSDGFTLGTSGNNVTPNSLNSKQVSWTFRKAPKFFDVVTYTGTGSARTVAHNLGSVPGCIIVKRTDTTGDWQVYHRANTANPETDYLVLNSTAATADSNTRWNDTLPTDSVFTVGTEATVNASGGTYVAYLFAHDAGGFGDDGEQNVISCGSFTTDGSGNASVTLGYEPQWLIYKRSDSTSNWAMADNMRGWSETSISRLFADSSTSEGVYTANAGQSPIATGFKFSSGLLSNSATYIYIAIRRGPMKTPTSGTEVFSPVTWTGNATAGRVITGFNFPLDMAITAGRSNGTTRWAIDRLRGWDSDSMGLLGVGNSGAESYANNNRLVSMDYMDGVEVGSDNDTNGSGRTYVAWGFQRTSKSFDAVCYTGTGSNRTVNHNLGVAPEFIIVKRRDTTGFWFTNDPSQSSPWEYALTLDFTSATTTYSTSWNNTAPTSTVFSLGTDSNVNASGGTYVAYLFATLAGVSKVGSYTGTGTTQAINCGFTTGARFVLIKRTDSSGEWYVWDSARGIVSGDDPYLLLRGSDPEVTNTDYVDTSAAGFEITSTAPAAINASGGTFIFLAIA